MPDGDGLAYWVHQRREGGTLDAIASAFVASAEFKVRFGSTGSDAAFLDRGARAFQLDGGVAQQLAVPRRSRHHHTPFGQNAPVAQKTAQKAVLISAVRAKMVDNLHDGPLAF